MKKNTVILAAVTLSGLLLAGCASSAAQVKRIDLETAKANAIEAAGFSSEEVFFSSAELDRRNGIEYYDVDFVADGKEYEYDIDALTGTVIGVKEETHHKNPSNQTIPAEEQKQQPASITEESKQQSASITEEPKQQSAAITEDDAKAIALSQVPGADESHIFKFRIDYDDGKLEYEGSIIFEEMEYEFEIDGHSGAIRDWEAESIYD